MDGLSRITDRIDLDAGREAEAIIAHAKLEADSLLKKAQSEAEKLQTQIIMGGRESAQDLLQNRESAAELDARLTLLSVKQALVSQAFIEALAKLADLPNETYRELLIKLALTATRTGDESLIMNGADRLNHGETVVKAVNAQLIGSGKKGQLWLSETTHPMSGGLIVKNGPIETVCTLEALIDLSKNNLLSSVTTMLFHV